MASRYAEVYAGWKADPEGFWAEAAKAIDWISPPTRIFDADQGVYGRWFVDGVCNTCFNAVDRHVESGRGDQLALIYDSPITGGKKSYTYAQLKEEVVALAAVLRDRGVEKGDVVIVYMPMVPEAVFAMLACARLGAVHSVVFGGFAARELATRIDDSKPKLIVSASCGVEPGRIVAYKPLLDGAIGMASHKVDACVILQRSEQTCELTPGRDVDMGEAVAAAKAAGTQVECVALAATDPLYVLYTSGTTGQPKGVVRDNGGHMVALKWTMENEFGIEPGEVFWAASDVGWVVGHSYIVYAPLLHGATTIVFEGKPVGTPDAGTFWRVISEHGVAALFTAPTAFRAIKGQDPKGEFVGKYDLAGFRTLFLAGERADPETIKWAEAQLGVPVIDHWWQTETGWAITGDFRGLGLFPVKPGSGGKPSPGFDLRVLDEAGREVPRGTIGDLVVKLPLPPSCLPTLWNNDAGFRDAYLSQHPGHYTTADAGMIDEDGYVWVMSRTDDIINVAGHRLSTGAMEEVLAAHPDVAECAVVGVKDALKGQVPLGLVVLKAGVTKDEATLERELVAMVRERIGPVAAFRTARVVPRLPKTRSGKVLRATIRKIADGQDYVMPPTIDDPVSLEEIKGVVAPAG